MPRCKSVPEVQGHRGSGAPYLENTLPAFNEAYEGGAEGVELDLQLTKDGQVAIFHDFTKNGKSVRASSLKELGATPFSELCQKLKVWGIEANLELKFHPDHSHPRTSLVERTLSLVAAHGLQASTYYSSFDREILEIIRQCNPKARLGLLMRKEEFTIEWALQQEVEILSPDHRILDLATVAKLRNAGFRVIPWTVNREEEWHNMVAYGVDAIITDRPRQLKKFLSSTILR